MLLDDSLISRVTLQKRALLFSWVTVLILFIFQPFGTYESELTFKYLRLAGYGVATFLAVFIAGLIEIELSKYKERIKRYPAVIIALYIFTAALFNHSYFVVAIYEHWQWQNQLMFVFYVGAIAIFPVTIIYFKHTRQTDGPKEGKQLVSVVEEKVETQANIETVQIIGDNKTDVLTVVLNDIVLMKSADNYCEILTKKENVVTTHLLRISLSKALAQLPDNKLIIRCHRSFGVNLSLVKTCQGNANGLKLEMKHCDSVVPVSRTFVNEVKQGLLAVPSPS